MPALGSFHFEDRRLEKELSRREDLARLERGEISQADLAQRNGLFSALDPSKAKVIARRARVRIDD